ncbi:MAG: hypothetical protein K6F01_13640 [Selenomonas sp.]|uniref:P-loop ATPase, Sll1717 family n=1 Tax=Selenomonas sp. TaxID=2053611 RepID=UPI0025EADBE2|nr:hypothetical protein [Selenomonas sp.]MCR5440450.1 hypothetical protein [Selenomonas sp.]
MSNKIKLIESIDFGNVDAESDNELERKFVKTSDFFELKNHKISLILGAKGSGKSALFKILSNIDDNLKKELFSGNEPIIVTGTGFKDISEISTDDIEKIINNNVNYEKLWELYIAFKIANKLGNLQWFGDDGKELNKYYHQSGFLTDYRILPILKGLYSTFIGGEQDQFKVSYKGVQLEVKNDGDKSIDIIDLLMDINNILEQENKDCWILFDKIDELYADDYKKRKECIESLFRVYLNFISRFPRIKFKIFLRTDIWSTLNLVNKSHISDKIIDLKWNEYDLLLLLMKRILQSNKICRYITRNTGLKKQSMLEKNNIEDVFYQIFPRQAYSGRKEAKLIQWMLSRIEDGLGGKYPREFINFGIEAKKFGLEEDEYDGSSLFSPASIKNAYISVSKIKCDTYLSEFPDLKEHFMRFQGQITYKYTRDSLAQLMNGLSPNKDEMIRQLYEAGVLKPIGNKTLFSANNFEIPKLFRQGLQLQLKGRL